MSLPPGQQLRSDFPRFGLPPYANKFPTQTEDCSIIISVPDSPPLTADLTSAELSPVKLVADFHCVTTWSFSGLEWTGIPFADFYRRIVEPLLTSDASIKGAVLSAQDGYRTSLLMEDLLRSNVLLAYALNGQPLSIEHGAPVRLVAPDQYGYKNLKHLKCIDFHTDIPKIKRGLRAFLDHPRARVAEEERGRFVPGIILRYLYRPMIRGTAERFRIAMQNDERKKERLANERPTPKSNEGTRL